MTSIFITGINGFVGSTLANYFSAKGYEVTGLGRQGSLSSIVDQRCSYIKGDITRPISRIDTDILIHTAALGSDTAPYNELYKNNVQGTANILEASSGVRQFIHISTSSVYDFLDKKMEESDAGNNFEKLSHYGKTKYLAEEEVLQASNIERKTILRPHAIYGVNDRIILPRLLKLVKGNKIILPRHLTTQVTLTNVSNLVRAIERNIEEPQKLGVYNICDDVVYALEEVIVSLLTEVTGKKLKVVHIPKSIWEGFVVFNERVRLIKEISKFGSDILTQPSMINMNRIKKELNFESEKISAKTFKQIGEWVNSEDGYKNYIKKHSY